MRAFITAVDEPTIELCKWALERNGFEVMLFQSESTLWEKLKQIYECDENFLRVDADVIVNRDCNMTTISKACDAFQDAWWIQFQCFGWYSQKPIYGGIQYIKREALPTLRENVDHFKNAQRPETELTRSYGMYNPRRFESYDQILGIHGYGIKNLKPVIQQKSNRGQSANYDFELAQRLNELC